MADSTFTRSNLFLELSHNIKELIAMFPDLDRIILDGKSHDKLMAWRDDNKELVRNCRPVLRQGIIEYIVDIKYETEMQSMYQYFGETDKDGTMLSIVFAEAPDGVKFPVLAFNFRVNYDNGMVNVFNQWEHKLYYPIIRTDERDTPTQSALTVYCSLMAYMGHYKEVIERVKSNKVSSKQVKKAKHGKKGSRVVRRAHRVEYKIILPDELQPKPEETEVVPKAKREFQVEAWNVKGHWRTYKKSGKTVFIKPFEKGKGKKKPVTYKV